MTKLHCISNLPCATIACAFAGFTLEYNPTGKVYEINSRPQCVIQDFRQILNLWFQQRIKFETGQNVNVQLPAPVRLPIPVQTNTYECGPRVLQVFQHLVDAPTVDPGENTAVHTTYPDCDSDVRTKLHEILRCVLTVTRAPNVGIFFKKTNRTPQYMNTRMDTLLVCDTQFCSHVS